jgi:dTDP-4-dehydrorhamnose reductase
MVVLVTGGQGQLGQAIQSIASNYKNIQFVFCDSKELDITSIESVKNSFTKHKPQFCINAAAYTAVDLAETEVEKAFEINEKAVKNLALACAKHKTVLLHVSTDFVFDGNHNTPYLEDHPTKPVNVYGASKLAGEMVIPTVLNQFFIIRTSWVYSQFGNNFMKTILRLASERDKLKIVNDQIGSPTYAVDLAEVLLIIIINTSVKNKQKINYGIYNFSNEGQCSWYDLALKILKLKGINIDIEAISTSSYPTLAKRPTYSALNCEKIKKEFNIELKNWSDSLKLLCDFTSV